MHPEGRSRVRWRFLRHVLGKTPAFVCEHRIRTKHGANIGALWQWSISRRGEAGETLGAIGTQSDVTAPKEAEARRADAGVDAGERGGPLSATKSSRNGVRSVSWSSRVEYIRR